MDVIVVGAGEAFTKHWKPAFLASEKFRIVGGVDTDSARVEDLRQAFPTVRWWRTERLPPCSDWLEAAVLILTPDHYPAIVEAVERGYTRLIVEKPIVSRLLELPRLEALIARAGIKVYAVDQYLPKAMPFQLTGGARKPNDPMVAYVAVRSRAWMGTLASVASLGTIEGISVSIIESGGFCLPDLGRRPWLRYDRETGGILADLGTHALAPLIAANHLDPDDIEVVDAKLLRIPDSNSGLVPLERENEVEMYVSALLLSRGLLIQASFGKVPGGEGIWSLSARFAGGMFYSGLRSDQGSVITFPDGMSVGFKLTVHPCVYALEEAECFFAGKLPGFDGNMRAVAGSLKICEKIKQKYFGK